MQFGARSGQLFSHRDPGSQSDPEISRSVPCADIQNTLATPPMDLPQHIQPENERSGEQFGYDGQNSFEGWVEPTLYVDYGGTFHEAT